MNGNSGFLAFVSAASGAAIIITAILQEGKKRDIVHKERIKALEMGIAPSRDLGWPATVAIAIGAVVPVSALVTALVATLTAPRTVTIGDELIPWSAEQAAVYYGCVWGAAISVSIVSVIGGSLLGWFLLGRVKNPRQSLDAQMPYADQKPIYDPEAYDTVSSRG